MASEYIEGIAQSLIKKFGTNDPFELCDCLGITVQKDDIGSLKGMYVLIKKRRYIVINENLDRDMARMVCAHELGHDQIHRDMARYKFIHDTDCNDITGKMEYEANIFASTVLLDDNEFLELASNGLDLHSLARDFKVDPNIVILKGRLLNSRGYRLRTFEHRADFLKY